MKTIALITPILQHYRLTFYEKLSKFDDDFDLHVFYGYKLKEDGRPSFDGLTKFKSQGFRIIKRKFLGFELVYNLRMFREVKKLNPDFVILQGIAGDLTNRLIISWARRKKRKIIIWACGWEPERVGSLLLKVKNFFVIKFFKKADYYLTYSTNASQYISNMNISDSLITTCYNGIETDHLISHSDKVLKQAAIIRKELELDGYLTFLYVGALIPEKKADFLIEAFSRLRDKYKHIKLIIIGDGPERTRIQRLISDNVLYLGRIIDDVDSYFSAVDCFVLPGIGGLALNQAMFWGKVCIVSKADGTEDDLVIPNISGYRFKSNDIGSLMNSMEERILEKQEIIDDFSLKSAEIINTKSNVNNMVQIFGNTIQKLSSS